MLQIPGGKNTYLSDQKDPTQTSEMEDEAEYESGTILDDDEKQ